eukprot:gnl/TRDRNA2_/TRDRNA2_74770_c0_seq1.p2 gnl/TRDRNA2_/TRDRNA2_74770_c0~~gnl/TRDRNA2_/TRDRNA2_74770_c0_seq1.p2  ORF type:complete len:137 (+),score=10.83 gnl/TRDRNA2_/TRDRNA2_74770_c0_seq1:80-490(+)
MQHNSLILLCCLAFANIPHVDAADCATSEEKATKMDCKTNRETDSNYGCGGKPADQMCSAYGNEYCCEGSESPPTMYSGMCSCETIDGASQAASDTTSPPPGEASDAATRETSDAASSDWLASKVCLIFLVQQFCM